MAMKKGSARPAGAGHKNITFVFRHDHARNVVITGGLHGVDGRRHPADEDSDGTMANPSEARPRGAPVPPSHRRELGRSSQATKLVPNPDGTEKCIRTAG